MTPDLAARKVIVQSYLYYVLDAPTMSDGEFDKLSVYVSQHWDELDPVRQWQLGSPEAIYSSGAHIKFTVYSVAAAHQLYKEANGKWPDAYHHKWKTDRKMKLRYCTAV